MKTQEMYQSSIENIKRQILKLIDEIHETRVTKNNMYEVLIQMESELKSINVSLDYIEKIQFDITQEGNININMKGENLLSDLTTKEYYVKYINISNSLLNKIKRYELLANMVNIDYKSYYYIMNQMGFHISKEILLGNRYSFERRLGSVCIARFPRSDKKTVDWYKSNKKKEELLAKGIKIKQDNNDGEDWIVYREDEDYLGFTWDKGCINTKNGMFYSFKTTSFINTPSRKNTDIEAICKNIISTLNCDKIGNIQKMLHLAAIDPKINAIYSNGL